MDQTACVLVLKRGKEDKETSHVIHHPHSSYTYTKNLLAQLRLLDITLAIHWVRKHHCIDGSLRMVNALQCLYLSSESICLRSRASTLQEFFHAEHQTRCPYKSCLPTFCKRTARDSKNISVQNPNPNNKTVRSSRIASA